MVCTLQRTRDAMRRQADFAILRRLFFTQYRQCALFLFHVGPRQPTAAVTQQWREMKVQSRFNRRYIHRGDEKKSEDVGIGALSASRCTGRARTALRRHTAGRRRYRTRKRGVSLLRRYFVERETLLDRFADRGPVSASHESASDPATSRLGAIEPIVLKREALAYAGRHFSPFCCCQSDGLLKN